LSAPGLATAPFFARGPGADAARRHKLPIDFKSHIKELSSIYDLFDSSAIKGDDDQGHYMLKKKWPAKGARMAPAAKGAASKPED
jgi:hypothetical protein